MAPLISNGFSVVSNVEYPNYELIEINGELYACKDTSNHHLVRITNVGDTGKITFGDLPTLWTPLLASTSDGTCYFQKEGTNLVLELPDTSAPCVKPQLVPSNGQDNTKWRPRPADP